MIIKIERNANPPFSLFTLIAVPLLTFFYDDPFDTLQLETLQVLLWIYGITLESAEQGIWIIFYLFSVVATGHWVNWSIAGCLFLILLFKGSSDFSEEITKEKYPLYSCYLKEVGRFLPFEGEVQVLGTAPDFISSPKSSG